MITRKEIRELADFESAQGCAISFYYQPNAPQNQAHREEAILVKDLARCALRHIEREGRNQGARADLERILQLAERLHGNARRAKAIFADSSRGLWREYDVPACLEKTQLFVNRRFHLTPLASLLDAQPRVCVCLADRTKARIFDYQDEQCKEVIGFFNELSREEGEVEGFDVGRVGRRVSELAKQHYKQVADTVLKWCERGGCEAFAVGMRDENWAEFEPVLHPYLKQNLIGRFSIDPVGATPLQVRDKVERLLEEAGFSRRQELLREVLGGAQRKGRGATGLRHVLRSLEQGEIQVLLLGNGFHAPGVECTHCGHVDMKVQASCAICSHPVKPVDDIADAILGNALRGDIEVVYVENDPALASVGHIGALLRFRAEQNTAARLAS